MKKLLIIEIITCVLLIAPTVSVFAGNTQSFPDEKNDVMDEWEQKQSHRYDYIDITEITFSRNGQTVTLTLTVDDNIVNKGNFSILPYIYGYESTAESTTYKTDVAAYGIVLTTSNDSYSIIYVNNICNIPQTDCTYKKIDLPTIGNTLTVSFDLIHNNETCKSIEATTTYTKTPDLSKYKEMNESEASNIDWSEIMALQSQFKSLSDNAYGDIIDNYDNGYNNENNINNNKANNDKTESSSDINLIYFFGVIITISIVGIAIVIYIIKR